MELVCPCVLRGEWPRNETVSFVSSTLCNHVSLKSRSQLAHGHSCYWQLVSLDLAIGSLHGSWWFSLIHAAPCHLSDWTDFPQRSVTLIFLSIKIPMLTKLRGSFILNTHHWRAKSRMEERRQWEVLSYLCIAPGYFNEDNCIEQDEKWWFSWVLPVEPSLCTLHIQAARVLLKLPTALEVWPWGGVGRQSVSSITASLLQIILNKKGWGTPSFLLIYIYE